MEVVVDEISGTENELQEGVGQGTGFEPPNSQDTTPDGPPSDATHGGLLSAGRAEVAGEEMDAVGTAVFFRPYDGGYGGVFLPGSEAAD